MQTILLFVPDLMFSTRIEDVARRLGYQIQSIDKNANFDAVIAEAHPALVVLTFDRTGEVWQRLAAAAKQAGVRTLAFGSHMNVESFKRAQALGCDQVVANSRMSAELPHLLKKWARE